MAEQRKAVIKNADMAEAMQQDAVDIASVALSKYNIEKVSELGVVLRSFRIGVVANMAFHLMTGCGGLHQEGIRQEARPNLVSQLREVICLLQIFI